MPNLEGAALNLLRGAHLFQGGDSWRLFCLDSCHDRSFVVRGGGQRLVEVAGITQLMSHIRKIAAAEIFFASGDAHKSFCETNSLL